ncbi:MULTISPECIES: hypothetical protein [Pseudomonas]|uniref:Uncharacterized protein n=1 Tax=Pseudomonas gingeri TaxID=117681 RepID=A0A7Y7WXI3_9PSED|nr:MULTISPECIES: hypothetical protein [Pseudomonas]MPQ70843.1 hypothetical protein [Pseudomonas sp. MWU12-2323]NWB89317.1 hypothetical protein [Pseudomonas gingeri]
MNTSDIVSTGSLAGLGLILLVLLIQLLKLRDIWQMLLENQKAARWARILEMENKELRSALRAEKGHVEQLRGKLVILQELIPAA